MPFKGALEREPQKEILAAAMVLVAELVQVLVLAVDLSELFLAVVVLAPHYFWFWLSWASFLESLYSSGHWLLS